MQISNKNGKIITSLPIWEEAFIEVDNAKHWREGRSAHSLALHFTSPSMDNSYGINVLLKCLGYLGYEKVVFDYAEIEHESRFDSFSGNGRIQDLMIWARSGNQPIAICIEAKVDESFGMSVPNAYKSKEKECSIRPNSKALQRLINICKHYYKGTEISELKNIRYQLLYYLAGSINEAKKINGIVFMPVFVYHTKLYNEKKGNKNRLDYIQFMKSLDFAPVRFNNESLLIYKNRIDGIDVFSAYLEVEL